MNTEQLKTLLVITEDAAKQSPMPYVHIDAQSCVELIKEVLAARLVELDGKGE